MLSEDPIVFLNGKFTPRSKATISVMDRGFLFGDGIYEVIPVYGGRLFRLEEHLDRLNNSLKAIRIESPYRHGKWRQIMERLLVGTGDQSIYLQITRGVAAKRDHAFPVSCEPTVFAMCSPIQPAGNGHTGVRAITLQDTRWQRCDIKAITLLANILLRQEAIDQGCTEAILIRDGRVTEGAASNVFVVIDGVLQTPAKGNDILPGITRDLIVELAGANGIPVKEGPIAAQALESADEIWLTSSTREILPVIELDGLKIADGRPGPVWQKMHGLLQGFKKSLLPS
ncbi:MAG: D-amino acid aminotransferase [Pseudomonadota bacterium]